MLSKIIGVFPAHVQRLLFKTGFFTISIVFCHFQSRKRKDIFLFSTRRGGSTLLGQLISANKGIRNIDQPLTTHAPKGVAGSIRKVITKSFLPKKDFSQYASLSHSEEKKIINYLTLIRQGKVSLNTWLEYKASRKKLFFYTDRMLLKLTDANAMIDWFAKEFNCHIIYLVRHPVANALSITKNNWGITAAAYLDDKLFCEKYLTPEQIQFGRSVLESNDYFQQAVLNWCLENIVPLNFSDKNFTLITYEELVICSDEIIGLLSSRFELNEKAGMLRISQVPSYSTVLSESSTVENIVSADNAADKYKNIINRWHDEISDEKLLSTSKTLEMFNVDAYSCESSIPEKKYLHFASCFSERVK